MQSGQLNRYFKVQKKQLVAKQDGSGDRETDWVDFFPINGQLSGLSVKDFIASRKDQTVTAVRILFRFSDIEPNTDWSKCRIYEVDTNLYYRIIGALPDNATGREYITLACEQGAYTWQDS